MTMVDPTTPEWTMTIKKWTPLTQKKLENTEATLTAKDLQMNFRVSGVFITMSKTEIPSGSEDSVHVRLPKKEEELPFMKSA